MSVERSVGEIEGLLNGMLKGNSGNGGMDMGTLMALLNNKGLGGENMIYFLFFFLLLQNGGLGGFGGNANNATQAIEGQIEAAINKASANQANFAAIKDLITGVSTDVGALATKLNCDFNSLNQCCCDMKSQLATISQQIGCSTKETIAAINNNGEKIINQVIRMGCDITQAIKDCCCETNRNIDNKFADLALRETANNAATRELILSVNQTVKDTANATQQLIINTSKDDEIRRLQDKLAQKDTNSILDAIAAKK